jgi:hypothetical protein
MGMANDQFNKIQAEINAVLEPLKATNDPVKRPARFPICFIPRFWMNWD